MPLSIDSVLQTTSEEEQLAFLIDTLQSIGFTATAWQTGSVQYNILRAVARTYASGVNIVRSFAENVIVNPRDAWLDLVGEYRFGIARLAAVATQRNIRFTNTTASPVAVPAGAYVATDDDDAIRYLTDSADTVPALGTVDIACTAETAGTAGNVPYVTDVVVQSPSLPGVTAALIDEDLLTVGTNTESNERYWTRCQLRWAELTYSSGAAAYELWALTAAPSLNRVKALTDYPGAYELYVVCDPGESSELTAVSDYIEPRQPPNDYPDVVAANVVTHAITYAPRVSAGVTAAQLNAAIQTMLDALPIGGILIAGASAGRLLRESITTTLLCNGGLGVQSVGLTAPSSDIVLGPADVVQGNFTVDLQTVHSV